MMRRLVALSILAAASTAVGVAQGNEPVPIVASVKQSADNEPGMIIRPMPPGSYAAVKVPVIALITATFEPATAN